MVMLYDERHIGYKNMNYDEFCLLRLLTSGPLPQRKIAESLNWSLGKANKVYKSCVEEGLLQQNGHLAGGGQFLEPYRVKHAIILAAGLSTRFAPVSYEVPKALVCVKGDVLIERIIEQLHEKGITDIYVVLGYKMEKFLYLKDKYNVHLAVNNEFRIKNTHSSINVVKEHLDCSYIICADNYFKENVFEQYEYRAFYGSMFIKEKNNERGFVFGKDNLIVATNRPAENQYVMWGHAYFDHDFAMSFLPILSSYYGKPGIEQYYWETIYIENLDKLKMHGKIYKPGIIYEFDSIEELKAFDPDYIKSNSFGIINRICRHLKCKPQDINIQGKLSGGLSNDIFKFSCKDKEFVLRYPRDLASIINSREREFYATSIAYELGVDPTHIYLDKRTGWKLSAYLKQDDAFDPKNDSHVRMLAETLRKLHPSNEIHGCGHKFDFYKEALGLKNKIIKADATMSSFLENAFNQAKPYAEIIKNDQWPISLCHNDISESNILFDKGKTVLIDWEFAGDNDPGFDLAKLFCLTDYNENNMKKSLSYFFGRDPSREEIRHILSCVVVNYLYWVTWVIFMNMNGHDYLSWSLLWYERFIKYQIIAQEHLD